MTEATEVQRKREWEMKSAQAKGSMDKRFAQWASFEAPGGSGGVGKVASTKLRQREMARNCSENLHFLMIHDPHHAQCVVGNLFFCVIHVEGTQTACRVHSWAHVTAALPFFLGGGG